MCSNPNCCCNGHCGSACTCNVADVESSRRNEYNSYYDRCLDQGVVPKPYDVWAFNEYGD